MANLGESSAGMSFASQVGNFQYIVNYDMINNAELAGGKKFDGNGYLKNTVSYQMDETKFELSYAISKSKQTTTAGALVTENESHTTDVISLGVVNSHVENENDFFWGAQLVSTQIKCDIKASARCDKKLTAMSLPIWFGAEVNASKWLSFRGAVKQSILSSIKDDVAYPAGIFDGTAGAVLDKSAGPNTTVVSMGVGFKFNKLTLDGTLATATTQTINSSSLMSQVGVTYNY